MSMFRFLFLVFLAVVAPLVAGEWHYPPAARSSVVDNYHGVLVPDPYRWLENPDSPETRKWIAEEDKLTESYLSAVPGANALKQRLLELSSPVTYPSIDDNASVKVRSGRYFFLRRDPGKNQPVLYWMTSRNGSPQVLLDPNTLSAEGTAALDTWDVSRDGKRLLYGIARSGSDWQDLFFRDVNTGKDLPDKLEWIKFNEPQWAPDNASIFYARFPKPDEKAALTSANFFEELCRHKLGEPQSRDEVIYHRTDHKDWTFQPVVTTDGRYLLVQINQGTRPENMVLYRDLHGNGGFVELIDNFQAQYSFITNEGPRFYFITTSDAPKGRLLSIDVAAHNERKEVVPQSRSVLQQGSRTGDLLVLVYEEDVADQVYLFGLDGQHKGTLPLPGKGHVRLPEPSDQSGEQFFSFESFTEPETLYSWRPGASAEPFERSHLPFDPNAFETRQVFYTSKDGTRIPMFLVGRKGFTPNPQTPCLLWGYGGFDISLTPAYRPLYLQWVETGGVFASANLRGGGEYGEEWHRAGMKANKQNVFDDFIAAAEWLIAHKYTSHEKLGIYGRSNGGLLIGAVLNQRPDLFGAAVAGVGVMDMLRFDQFTIGNAWTSDYGSPQNATDFKVLRAYSPLHNIRQGGDYPATLILTSDHDDRVVPAHSFKYAATLQHAQAGPAPILIRIETSAGHGGGKPISKQVDEAAAIIDFLQRALHIAQ